MKNYEEIIEKLLTRITELETLVAKQATEIAELKRRLNKNSSNSSKPPSSDGLKKAPRTTSLREQGKNKSGGQTGHKGTTLEQVSCPNNIITHTLHECPDCGESLSNKSVHRVIKRQVFDLPPIQVDITEHRVEMKYCSSCQRQVQSDFPLGVKAPVQYGNRVRSWIVYYQNQHMIPEDRIQQLFMDMYSLPISTASIASFTEKAYQRLKAFELSVLARTKKAPVKHLDETGFRVSGKTQWMHTLSTQDVTYYHVSPKRKSLIDGVTGIAVHDHWRPYYQIPNVSHALCNQHHLRELKAVAENDKEAWAAQMSKLLTLMLRCRHRYDNKPIPLSQLNRLERLYDSIIHQALTWHESQPPLKLQKIIRGRPKLRHGHNLLLRLKHHREEVLRFLHNPQVPFTNNDAERDLRMVKCKQKVSGGFRTSAGAEYFARIRGFISTARKQQWDILESILAAFTYSLPILATE
ncbi:IS66 family transposase [Legionella pneumophila]|uniref:IS66 family transposase n=1 Tax=Legionella pneumophila TaxID=446 RepID=UPI0010A9D2F1|nr:IS66 family transposase [Legionella pneumophila]TID86703.1 IS66 family transposase [Legionella pneumophila]